MLAKNVKRRRNIKYKIRKKINGNVAVPRLSVFRSNKGIYAQLIDDINGQTILSVSSTKMGAGTKTQLAKQAGKVLGQKAVAEGYTSVVFDRSGYLYHGRVKALAEGAREAGLNF